MNNHNFTIITYNIFDGRNAEKLINNILSLIQNGADIICLQEVRQAYKDIEFSKLLRESLPKHFEVRYFLENDMRWFDYGLGILWNTQVFSNANFQQFSLPKQPHLTFWNKLFYWLLGLEPKIIKRGALIGTFMSRWAPSRHSGQDSLRITNLHLDFQGGDAHRAAQIKALMNHMATQPKVEREIICGDFNTLGLFSKQNKIASLQNQLGNKFQSVIQKPYNSAIIQQLDYIFVKGLTVETAEISHLKGSDHYPITANLI